MESKEVLGFILFVLKVGDIRACLYANQNNARVRGGNCQSEMLR